ncbi:MAG: hypothetical protein WA840_14345 [Caulobacteraceae bacterium]
MPAARASQFRSTRAPARKAPRSPAPLRIVPPSGELITAVIQYADLIKDMGGDRSLLRLSERRMSDPVICEALGREAARLRDIAVLWDDEEDQIVRVLDAAAGDLVTPASAMQPFGDEALELTSSGLAYLSASQGRLH